MAGPSTAQLDAVLKAIAQNITFPAPTANVYVSLHTADPGQTGASEVVNSTAGWVGYARVAASTGTAGTGAGAVFGGGGVAGAAPTGTTTRSISNSAALTFPNSGSTSSSVTVTYFGIWDAATGGNWIRGAALSSSQVIGANASGPSFAAGSLVLSQS
jgi:hypothetical protein